MVEKIRMEREEIKIVNLVLILLTLNVLVSLFVSELVIGTENEITIDTKMF
jgi:predicted histidine transporter YuiF (NhaC family)